MKQSVTLLILLFITGNGKKERKITNKADSFFMFFQFPPLFYYFPLELDKSK